MSNKKQRKKYTRPPRNNTPFIIGGVIIAVFVVGLLVWFNSSLAATPAAPVVSAGKVRGQANAPVTVDIYADLQCPICARAEAELNQLAPKYIDTGKVKVVYHHFAFIGDESEWAAEAAECAGEQNQFWNNANYLFTHQAGENVGAFSRDNLKQIGAQLGLDSAAFNACVDSGKYASVVEQETNQGKNLGINSTPTFFINGTKYVGLMSTDQFATLFDSLLQK